MDAVGAQPVTMSSGAAATMSDAAREAAARLRAAGAGYLPPPVTPQRPAPAATVGVGHDRALLDGVTLDRPFEMIPTAITNLVERITGTRDDRSGRSITQVLLAGQMLVQAGLEQAAKGKGVVAAGSSVLGKVLPVAGVVSGAMQVWKGWNELESHEGGVLSVLGSRTARTGLLNVVASALMFVPGVGSMLASAATRLVAAANEYDFFSFLDAPTRSVEEQGYDVARKVYLLDETPTDPYDRTRRGDATTYVRAAG